MKHEQSGRVFEVFVGLLSTFTCGALLFWSAVELFDKPYSIKLAIGVGTLILLAFWLAKVGYRLLLNRPSKSGLISSFGTLKLLSLIVGVTSFLICILSVLRLDILSVMSHLSVSALCFATWQLAKSKQREQEQHTS
ncbi:MAG: hypothetical protein GYB58_06295 [Gammaproteobacteria bacterium]|nr:hypothetical protein [Gammaproteobacteria bacterium]